MPLYSRGLYANVYVEAVRRTVTRGCVTGNKNLFQSNNKVLVIGQVCQSVDQNAIMYSIWYVIYSYQ